MRAASSLLEFRCVFDQHNQTQWRRYNGGEGSVKKGTPGTTAGARWLASTATMVALAAGVGSSLSALGVACRSSHGHGNSPGGTIGLDGCAGAGVSTGQQCPQCPAGAAGLASNVGSSQQHQPIGISTSRPELVARIRRSAFITIHYPPAKVGKSRALPILAAIDDLGPCMMNEENES